MSQFEKIAIIGSGCILPGCTSCKALSDMVFDNKVAIAAPPEGYWRIHPDSITTGNIKTLKCDQAVSAQGGYIPDQYDLSWLLGEKMGSIPLEGLDPLFRACFYAAQQALEDAGALDNSPLLKKSGLIMGNLLYPTQAFCGYAEAFYLETAGLKKADSVKISNPFNRFSSELPAMLTARLFGMEGRAFSLDAACASSLYAIKLSCDLLHRQEADMMLSGAVCFTDPLYTHIGFSQIRAMSPSGRSRPFNIHADGLIPGQGAAFVVLKRLNDAIAANDNILGVISGIGLSNDGRMSGFLSPSSRDQVRCIKAAYDHSGVDPSEVGYIECHATGTPVGDRVEIESMQELFHSGRKMPIGSLKANVGHLITASGAAGIIKVLEMFKQNQIPATPNAHPVLPEIERSDFYVPEENEAWPDCNGRRIAAISSFGFGGNNAHLVMEQWQGVKDSFQKTEKEREASKSEKQRDASKKYKERELLKTGINHHGRCPDAPDYGNNASICTVKNKGETSTEKQRDPSGKETKAVNIAVVSLGARTSLSENADELAESVLKGHQTDRQEVMIDTVSFDPGEVAFPPKDIEKTLGQQLLVLKATVDAMAMVDPPDVKRTGVFIGMEVDSEITRARFRWAFDEILQELDRPISIDDARLDELRNQIAMPTDSASFTGSLSNIVANRINSQYDFKSAGFVVAGEALSGDYALEVAVNALKAGEIDTAIVGAVDICNEMVHKESVKQTLGIQTPPLDAGLVLILKREADAVKSGERILCTIDSIQFGEGLLYPSVDFQLGNRNGNECGNEYEHENEHEHEHEHENENEHGVRSVTLDHGNNVSIPKVNLDMKFLLGYSHAASGMLNIMTAVMMLAKQRRLDLDGRWVDASRSAKGTEGILKAEVRNKSFQGGWISTRLSTSLKAAPLQSFMKSPQGVQQHLSRRPLKYPIHVKPMDSILSNLKDSGNENMNSIPPQLKASENEGADSMLSPLESGKNQNGEHHSALPSLKSIQNENGARTLPIPPSAHEVYGNAPFISKSESTNEPSKPEGQTVANPRTAGNSSNSGDDSAPQTAFLAAYDNLLKVHTSHLRLKKEAHRRYMDLLSGMQRQIYVRFSGTSKNLTENLTEKCNETPAKSPPEKKNEKQPEMESKGDAVWETPHGPTLDRLQLEKLATGKISDVFGDAFAPQDEFEIQVRMPAPPLLLCDRVLGIEGEPLSMGKGRIWTETVVRENDWFLYNGRMPAGIFMEAGQADLLLVSWLGIDMHNRGRRVYRLLGCEVTFHGTLPKPNDCLRFQITADGFASHGDVRLFFFHYDCWVNDRLAMSMRNGQAGFFTHEELKQSAGVIWDKGEISTFKIRHPLSSVRNEHKITYPFSPSPFMERGLGGEVCGQVISDRFLKGHDRSPVTPDYGNNISISTVKDQDKGETASLDHPVAQKLPFRCIKRSFSKEEIMAYKAGDFSRCFKKGFEDVPQKKGLPGYLTGNNLLFDEVTELDPLGGPGNSGIIRAKMKVLPDLWFFPGHFLHDNCMPGTLMAEACLQIMAFYMNASGHTLGKVGWYFSPVREQKSAFSCRGQVTPASREVSYTIYIDEIIPEPFPTLFVHAVGSVDGLDALYCNRLGLQLLPDDEKVKASHADISMSGLNAPLHDKISISGTNERLHENISIFDMNERLHDDIPISGFGLDTLLHVDAWRISLKEEPWIKDHCPTYCIPTLPLTYELDMMVDAVLTRYPGKKAVRIDKLETTRWMAFHSDVLKGRTCVRQFAKNAFDVSLEAEEGTDLQPQYIKVVSCKVTIADEYPAAGIAQIDGIDQIGGIAQIAGIDQTDGIAQIEGTENLTQRRFPYEKDKTELIHRPLPCENSIKDLTPRQLPYEDGIMFHGESLQLMTRWYLGKNGAMCEIDAHSRGVPYGRLHPGVLDASLHAIPHDEMGLWDERIPPSMICYPIKVEHMTVYRDFPRTGTIHAVIQLEKIVEQRLSYVDFELFHQQELICAFRLIEYILPKGRLIFSPPLQRREFLLYRNYVPNMALSRFSEDGLEIFYEDIREADYLKGSVASTYQAHGSLEEMAQQVVMKDLAASRLCIHPGDVILDDNCPGRNDTCSGRYEKYSGRNDHIKSSEKNSRNNRVPAFIGKCLNTPYNDFLITSVTGERSVRAPFSEPEALDIGNIKARWVGMNGNISPILLDMGLSFIHKYLRRFIVKSPATMKRFMGKPMLYLANHQTGVESFLFLFMIHLLQQTPIRVVAKKEHQQTLMGKLLSFGADEYHAGAPIQMIFLNRENQMDTLHAFQELEREMKETPFSLLVHVEGTRSTVAGKRSEKLSSVLVDLAMNLNMPIVPVRFYGGLPVEETQNKFEFPVNQGMQDIYVGTPMEISELKPLNYAERIRRILDKMNTLGAPFEQEVPLPPDIEFGRAVMDSMENMGLEKIPATLFCALKANPEIFEETREFLKTLMEKGFNTTGQGSGRPYDTLFRKQSEKNSPTSPPNTPMLLT